MKPVMTVTAAACEYIKKVLVKDHGVGFRVSIKKTGCSGYSYLPTIIKEINPTDVEIETAAGIKLYIDSAWADLLNGIQIDYQEEDKSGLKQKRLVFTNPNEASRCGCGESFHIE